MNTAQHTVLGDAHARRSDPVSSHAAGIAITDKTAGLYAQIHAWLQPRWQLGGTTLEIAEATGLDRVTVSPRMRPMEKLGLVRRSTEKRAGPSGVASVVWIATGIFLSENKQNV